MSTKLNKPFHAKRPQRDARDHRDLQILRAYEAGWSREQIAWAFRLPEEVIETIVEEDGR